MRKQISENLIWKIGSVLIAVIIWITVMNIVRPLVEERVTVPIEIVSESDEHNINNIYNIRDNISNARVSFRVRSDYAGKINSSDLKAVVEIPRDYNEGYLPVKIKYLNNVQSYIASSNYYPTNLFIIKDEMVQETFEIVSHTTGELAPGLRVGSIMLGDSSVVITGNRTDVENVKEVRVDIPLGEKSENFSGEVTIKICDAYGNEITNSTARADKEKVIYSVLLHSVKRVNVEARTVGRPFIGYKLNNISINPTGLSLSGTKDSIAGIYSIVLPEIDITNLLQTTEFEFITSELLPDGIIDVGNTEKIVVTVNIKSDGTYVEPEEETLIATGSSSKIISPSINRDNQEREETNE